MFVFFLFFFIQVTFEYALEHSHKWTLRVAKSRLADLIHRLEEARGQYNDVFDETNQKLGDVAGDVERTFNQVSKKLDELEGLPVMPDDYQGHEEFIRQEQEKWSEDDHRLHNEMQKHYKMKQML